MPEGDTVFRLAHRLSQALTGQEVVRFDIRVPESATADLRGRTVHGVVSRGKHLLHRIGDHSLHSHLRMDGEWHTYRPGARWRMPGYKARAIVGTAEWDTVGFDLAMVEVLPTKDEDRVLGHLGPDPLLPDWDPAEAVARVSADARPVFVSILDQRNVAGFGNVYANELLFVRGILPTRPAREVDAVALIDLGARMMEANRWRSNRTFTGSDRPGQRFWVYGRANDPCRRCGTPVRRGELGPVPTQERLVYWCPHCQT